MPYKRCRWIVFPNLNDYLPLLKKNELCLEVAVDRLNEVTVVKVSAGVAIDNGASTGGVEVGAYLQSQKPALGLPIPSVTACSDRLPGEAAVGVVVPGEDPDPDRGPDPDRTDGAVAAIRAVGGLVFPRKGGATMNETIPDAVEAVEGEDRVATHRNILLAVAPVPDRDRVRSRVPADPDRDLCPVHPRGLEIRPIMNIVDLLYRQSVRLFTWVD